MRAGFFLERKPVLNSRVRAPLMRLFFKKRNRIVTVKNVKFYFKYIIIDSILKNNLIL
jgi:hypothetical protein